MNEGKSDPEMRVEGVSGHNFCYFQFVFIGCGREEKLQTASQMLTGKVQ